MQPNAIMYYNPDPDYLRSLIKQTGLTQADVAKLVGVEPRSMRRYLAFTDNKSYQQAPYAIQFCLECLASKANPSQNSV